MKRNILLLIISAFTLLVTAQTEQELPLNQDFIKAQSNVNGQGFIPSPLTYSFDKMKEMRDAIALPSKFDMRDSGLLTAVRNQQSVNTCWGFVTMDALQATWAKSGFSTTNYSVENLANCHGFDVTKNGGGTADMAIAYLSRFAGPVLETSDPYVNSTSGTCKTTLTKADKAGFMSEALHIPKDITLIKQMVYRYGAVFTALSSAGLVNYYNSTTHATYSPDASSGSFNHAGTIIGWDDDFVVSIPSKSSPSKPGAWIVKGTYGTSFGENGYYYVSYEDYFIGNYATIFPQRIEKEQIDTVYYYDKLGCTYVTGLNRDSAFSLSKFTAPQTQTISAIGINARSAGTTVDIDIYTGKSGDVLSGFLASYKGYYCSLPGFHTVPIQALVSGNFYVQVKYKTPGNNLPIPTEKTVSGYSTVTLTSPGYQWVKYFDSDPWRNVGTETGREYNICLKVYAKNTSSQPLFTVNKNRICLNDSVVFRNKSIGSYSSYEWNFGNGATPATATTTSTSDSIRVIYTTAGMKTVMLVGINGSQRDTLIKGNAVEMLSGLPIAITSSATNNTILKNKSVTLKAGYDADSYLWTYPASISGTKTDSIVYTMGETNQLFKIKALLNQCEGTDSITIKVTDKCALYDDIEDAKELTLDMKEGPFINVCATSQLNEPKPDVTQCVDQAGWCEGESRIDNSLWFKFTAPSSGSVKIVTSGFDNQIALYDAKSTGTYNDIMSGDPSKYTIIAANDDSSATNIAATIETVTGLTAGKTYWIQMDGSYNGAEGSTYITVVTEGLNAINLAELKSYILPNPVKNKVLRIENAGDIKSLVLMDLSGKIIWQSNYKNNNSIHTNLSSLTEGYYVLKINTNSGLFSEKILLEK